MRRAPAASAAALCLMAFAAAQTESKLPEGPGQALIERSCQKCHGLERIVGARNTVTGWAAIVDQMVSKGALASDSEMAVIITYLGKNFGKDKAPAAEVKMLSSAKVNVNKVTASELAIALDIPRDMALAIVAYRADNGPFKRWEDLGNAPGADLKQIEPAKDRILF